MEIDSLTRQVLECQQTGNGLSDLRDRIAVMIYFDLPGGINLSEDEKSDFFCLFYPRIENLIKRFIYTGKPFTVYLNSSVRGQLKGFRIIKIRERRLQVFYRSPLCWETLQEEAPKYLDKYLEKRKRIPEEIKKIFNIGEDGKIHDPAYQRRFLYLVLKNSYFIDQNLVETLCKIGGFEPKWLLEMLEQLKTFIAAKENRLKRLISRRNFCHFKIYKLEELYACTEGKKREEILFQIKRNREKLCRYVWEIQRIHLYPTNREIALVTGIPKGTIDSALFHLKKREQELSAGKDLQYAS